MKAYIDIKCIPAGLHGLQTEFCAEVVSEQDYFECGPWAHSFRTKQRIAPAIARLDAEAWAKKNGYTIVNGAEEL